jgi:hypothetical protein
MDRQKRDIKAKLSEEKLFSARGRQPCVSAAAPNKNEETTAVLWGK